MLLVRALAVSATARRPYVISFDVNHRPALWPKGIAPDALRYLANRADIVLVGLDEAQDLWGPDLTPTTARDLLPGPRILVVKDGSRAATAFTASETVTVPALRVTVAEPVGAVDVFAAGFFAGLLRGDPYCVPAPSRRPRL
ncbi:PfkB family carbohydrate kinase [Streptomyces sp. LaPpAH-108]|uniref:PfkB family carbohydrate kinase n=1 Tax=Streptomyces sp. LaPpAH-108 TaxID=1155714 RepID=UPI000686EDAF|nr:PfkB family carbohydrate kinase [Streptomyces sp. LaPpAH-108]